jgi:phage shock protein A
MGCTPPPVRRRVGHGRDNIVVGILDRISTILRANINALLDSAENPELMLEQIIRDMGEAITEARTQVAEMIAQEKLLEADVNRYRAQSNEWHAKARLAVDRGRDDLAREALTRKADYDRNGEAMGTQLATQQQVVSQLKIDLAALQSKYDSAVRNKQALITRHKAAIAQQKVAETARQLSAIDPSADLSRMEAKIREEEARAQGILAISRDADFDQQFAELHASAEVERQLAELKGPPPSLPGTSSSAKVVEHDDVDPIEVELRRMKDKSS